MFFQYRPASGRKVFGNTAYAQLEDLVVAGVITYEPITYEDFLLISAAGIFRSNLPDSVVNQEPAKTTGGSFAHLTAALGCPPFDPFSLYEELQEESLRNCERALRIEKMISWCLQQSSLANVPGHANLALIAGSRRISLGNGSIAVQLVYDLTLPTVLVKFEAVVVRNLKH